MDDKIIIKTLHQNNVRIRTLDALDRDLARA
jgi:hypothetical protein